MNDIETRFRLAYDAVLEEMPDPPEFERIRTVSVQKKPPKGGPGWLAAAGTAALVVVLIGGVVLLQGGGRVPTTTEPGVTPTTVVLSTTAGSAVAEDGPLFGWELPWTLIFDDGLEGVVVVDLNNPVEIRVPVAGQRPGDQPYRLDVMSGRLIVGWGTVYAQELGTLRSKRLGDATIYVPAAESDRVWMVDYPGGRVGDGDPVVWQMFATGTRANQPVVLDADGLPAIGIPGGLALETEQGVALWNAETGEVTQRLGTGRAFVSDVSRDGKLAWCEKPCTELHVTTLETGDDLTVRHPFGTQFFDERSARFSNNLRFLAAPAGNDVVVFDLETGETTVAFSLPDVDDPLYLAWAPSGPDLFASTYSYDNSEVTLVHYVALNGETRIASLPLSGTLSFVVVDSVQAKSLIQAGSFDECPVTLPDGAPFSPPPPYPAEAREGDFWYGSDELWTTLSVDGEYAPRMSVWWSVNFPGGVVEAAPEVSVTRRRLDIDGVAYSFDRPGTSAYTPDEGWFMIADIDPDEPGCWEVTATYKGATLSYVYEVP